MKAVRDFARKEGLPRPSDGWLVRKVTDEMGAWGSDTSAAGAVEGICLDYRESLRGVKSKPARLEPGGDTHTSVGFSYYVAAQVRPYAEAFRQLVWESERPPFASPQTAAEWLQQQHKREAVNASEVGGDLKGFFPGVGTKRWSVRKGGVLDKLRRLCVQVHSRYQAWSQETALAFILWDDIPLLKPSWERRISASNAMTITLTIPAPATEEEVLEAYRAALRGAGIDKAPEGLLYKEGALLGFVYDTPGSWAERLSEWPAWRERFGSKEKPLKDYNAFKDGRRNLWRDWKNAEAHSTWSGNVEKERPDWGLYMSGLGTPAEREPVTFNPVEAPAAAPWDVDPPEVEPQAAQAQPEVKPPPVDLDRFMVLPHDAPLNVSQEEAAAILTYFSERGDTPDWSQYDKVEHLLERLAAIAEGNILRPEDR